MDFFLSWFLIIGGRHSWVNFNSGEWKLQR